MVYKSAGRTIVAERLAFAVESPSENLAGLVHR